MTIVSSKVMDILQKKGSKVYSTTKTETALDALKMMSDKGVGCLVVYDGDDIAGIVTERDFTRKVSIIEKDSKALTVNDIMTPKIICVCEDESVTQCMAVMTEKRIRHLPVVCDGKIVGLVSIGDLIKQVSREQRAAIKYLKDYISGAYPA